MSICIKEKMEQRLNRIANVLKDVTTHDWKVRVEALRELRSSLSEIRLITLKPIIGNLVKQIGDGRSIVMQEACETARDICMTYGTEPEFSAVADAFVKACLPIVPSSTKVMSDAAKACLQQVVSGTTRGYQTALDRFVQGCTANGKAACFRLECVRLIEMCVREWDAEWLAKGDTLANMEMAIRKALRDADSDVRISARSLFGAFARTFPDEAKRSLREMEPEDRQRFQELFPGLIVSATNTSVAMSAVKRTPHHSNSVRKVVPPTSARQPISSRKPLQSMPLNAVTPASKVVKPKETKTVTFVGLDASMPITTAKKTDVKKKTTARDKISRAVIDCFGTEDTAAARLRRTSAMREMAAVFVSQPMDLHISDFISSIHAIESCVSSLDESVCAAGLDAFGTFMYALDEALDEREAESISLDMLRKAFPLALKRSHSGNQVLDEAGKRAVDACVEVVPHTNLLSTVVAFQKTYQDDVVLPIFVARMQTPSTNVNSTPRSSLAEKLAHESSASEGEEEEGADENLPKISEEEYRLMDLAKDLNDNDAEVRKRAVDELVSLRMKGSGFINQRLEATLSVPQLRLLDVFVKQNATCFA